MNQWNVEEIKIYNTPEGGISIEVKKWYCLLFSKLIGLHLKSIYKSEELDKFSTIEEYSVVRQEGKRKVKRQIKHYNSDAIISVG